MDAFGFAQDGDDLIVAVTSEKSGLVTAFLIHRHDIGETMQLYVLDESGEPKEINDFGDWKKWKDNHEADCIIKSTPIDFLSVETRFIGYDQGGEKKVFQTFVRGSQSWTKERWGGRTQDEALGYHVRMVNMVRNWLGVTKPLGDIRVKTS